MSHGTGNERSDSTEVVGIDNELLHTAWILEQFDNDSCSSLAGKPKIFIFQCCRYARVSNFIEQFKCFIFFSFQR